MAETEKVEMYNDYHYIIVVKDTFSYFTDLFNTPTQNHLRIYTFV